jgi:hypothetical protein
LKPKIAAPVRARNNRLPMKKIFSLLCAGILLVPAVVSAASNFEGSMKVQMISPSSKDKPMEMDYLVKGSKARVTTHLSEKEKGGTMIMIMDYAKLESLMIMPEQKMVMVMPIKEAIEATTSKEAANTELEKTGEKEKILGYTCEKYRMKSPDAITEMWVTDELGAFAGMGAGGMGAARSKNATMQAWEKALAGKNLFPLRIVGFNPAGKETFRMQWIAVKKESVPNSAFDVPEDYQKMDMSGMGGLMKGMMKGFGR